MPKIPTYTAQGQLTTETGSVQSNIKMGLDQNLASALAPNAKLNFKGIRPGEKLHEQMVGSEDALYTFEYSEHFKILPAINNWHLDSERIKDGKPVAEGFQYSSDNNKDWMTKKELLDWVEKIEIR